MKNGNDEVRKQIMIILSDGKPHNSFTMMTEINEKKLTNFPITDNSMSGALHKLKKNGKIVMIKRSVYQLAY